MGDSEAVAADATVGVDAAATTATYVVPDASSSGDKSSFGSESAMQGSSNEQEASISVDHQANHGTSVSEPMSVTTENGSISAEAQINSSDEDRLWSMVRSNGSDFNSWTALIQEAERVAEWSGLCGPCSCGSLCAPGLVTALKKYEEYMMHFWKNFPYVMGTGKNMQTMKLTLVLLIKLWKFMNGQS